MKFIFMKIIKEIVKKIRKMLNRIIENSENIKHYSTVTHLARFLGLSGS